MSVHTRSQKLAQEAYPRVQARFPTPVKELSKDQKEYRSFAKKFPALIHTCGLAQAVAFADAKKHDDYLKDLAAVLFGSSEPALLQRLHQESRESQLANYMRLSRNALSAASWLKRYVEAVAPEEAEATR